MLRGGANRTGCEGLKSKDVNPLHPSGARHQPPQPLSHSQQSSLLGIINTKKLTAAKTLLETAMLGQSLAEVLSTPWDSRLEQPGREGVTSDPTCDEGRAQKTTKDRGFGEWRRLPGKPES